MADVKVERKVSMTRAEAASWLTDIAASLSGDGRVSIRLADSTVEMDVPDQVRCEAEVEVDGDEVEFEFELKFSTSAAANGRAHPKGSVRD
jgi:amphi-Trp domain-containing protein